MQKKGNIVLAAYGSPGIMGIQTLLGMRYTVNQLALITYESDARNACLLSFAKSLGIETLTKSVKSTEVQQWIEDKNPDLLCSLHYRNRIPASVLSVPNAGAINLHPSLLPEYRGCFSVPWVLINGEEETGVSFHYMEKDFDTGNLLVQEPVPIKDDDTAFSLFHRLIEKGMQHFEMAVTRALNGEEGISQKQDGTYFDRSVPYGGIIDSSWNDAQIDRFIRAMIFPPYPPAIVRIQGIDHQVTSLNQYKKLLRL